MDISIILDDDSRINPGYGIPIKALHTGIELIPAGRNFCHWFPGSPNDDIEGKDILVTGKEYIIGHRRYNLNAGYGLVVRLTPKFTLIPQLRKAVSKETEVIRNTNGFPTNEYWPRIQRIWDEPVETKEKSIPNESFDFVQDALNAMSELSDLSETFNFDKDEEEEEEIIE